MKTLLLLVSAGLAVAQTPTPVALVNPGFEAPYKAVNLNGGTITGQVANGWSDSSSYDKATVQYSQETTNPHGGTSCQKIVVANATMGLQQQLQLRVGNIYTASVWMRGLPGTVGSLLVQQGASPYTVYFKNDVALTSAWQQVSIQGYITTTEMGFLKIVATGPATLWVDDAAVSYTPGVVAPTPNLGPIPSSFFGMHPRRFNNSRLWNGGLEPPSYQVGVQNKVSGDVAANWLVYSGNSDVTAAFSQDTNNPHSGASSQKISVSSVNSGNVQLYQVLSLLPGATYTMTAWLRGDPAAKVQMNLYEGASNTSYAKAGVSLTSDWKQVSITGQVNGTGLVSATFVVSSPGTVWVDDVSVTDASGQPVSGGAPWPAVGFGTLRLWDGAQGTTWYELEPAKGAWDWERLDNFVTAAGQHGVSDILLTLGQSPGWASSSPDTVAGVGGIGQPPGATAPPADIQDWRDYITAVAQRYQGRIRYYEIWNEPDLPAYYTGTVAQLVALTQEAYKILKAVDPGNTVVSPAVTTAGSGYLDQLLAAGVANYVDMLAYHIYTNPDPPESAGRDLVDVRLVMAKYGLAKMPLWNTEGASGDNTTPPDLAAKYIARRYLTDLAFGSVRYYWYGWDLAGPIWLATVENDRRVLTPAGRAYGFLYGWLVGSTLTNAVIDAAGNWQIWLTKPDGTQALVVWNPTKNTQLTLPATFPAVSSHDLAGGVASVTSNTVTVTDSPMLLTTTVDAPPAITSVVNAAEGNGIAPGGLATLTGSGLATAVNQPGFFPLPYYAGGVTVALDGLQCPLAYADSGQVTFQIPYSAAIDTDSLTVSSPAGVSAVYPLAVSAAAPGIYTSDGVRAIAANADGTLNSPDNPAAVNSTIQVGLTGIGLLTLPIADGQGAPASPAFVPALAASAQIGGMAAPVQSLALAPGMVGIAQAAIVVPALTVGDYPLVITVGGVDSNPATVSIAGSQ